LIAVAVGYDAITSRFRPVVIQIEIVVGGAFNASQVKQTACTLVTEKSPAEFAYPIEMSFFDLVRLAHAKPAEVADGFRVLRARD
jgi:hypothetical protein